MEREMNKFGFVSLAALLAWPLCGTADAQKVVPAGDRQTSAAPRATHESGLIETLAATGNFKTLLSLLQASGMKDDGMRKLAGGRPYTLLAPNDAAFAALPKGSVDALRNPARLRAFLLAHMLPGTIKVQAMFDSTQAASRKAFENAHGRVLGFSCNGRHSGMHNPVVDGRARIGTFQDVAISGGIVHELGGVLAIE
jgi:uncharacterized surface protein with fasciclin (FAS1) repeats